MEFDLIFCLCIITFSFICNLLVQKIFLLKSKIDKINHRSSHSVVATKTGGISVFFILSLFTIFFYITNNQIFDYSLMLPLGIIFLTGVYDDLYDADFKLKFLVQIIVAKLFIDYGFSISNLNGFLGINELPNILSQILTVICFLVIVNSINFIDGIDGLASSISIYIISAFEFFTKESELFHLNVILIMSLLPLFYFNFKRKNKVFLGDSGSLLLGAIISINTFSFFNHNTLSPSINPVLVAISILFYPVFDLFRVFIIRIYNKKSPFVADQIHLHHVLLNRLNSQIFSTLLILFFNLSIFLIILFKY